jgi:hypothetical protein
VYSNKGPGPLPRGDNHKNVKMGWGHLKIFSGTNRTILTRLGINHPWGKGIQICSNEGWCPFLRGDDSERVKIHKNILKISTQEPMGEFQSNLVQIILG